MAISAVGTPVETESLGLTTYNQTTTTAGNAVILATRIDSSTLTITGVSGGGCTWRSLGTAYVAATRGRTYELWLGTVTSVVTASAVTVSWSGSVAARTPSYVAQEFTNGQASNWALEGRSYGGVENNTSSTTINYPSLTAAGAGRLYFGRGSASAGTPTTSGTPAGFTFDGSSFLWCYGLTTAAGTVTPTQTNSASTVSGAVAAVLVATPAPVVANLGASVTGSSASAAVPVPPGVAIGDMVVVSLFKTNNAAVTPPAGFTALTPQAPATDTVHYMWWKIAAAADTGTYNFTWTGSTVREAVAVRVLGAASTPLDTGAGAPNSAGRATNGTTTPAVSLTTQGVNRLLLWVGANFTGGAWTPPTGYAENFDNSTRLSIASTAQDTAGATGSVTGFCATSEYETAWLLSIVAPVSTANLSGSDSGTGIDAGYVALLQTGSDTGTGADTGYVAIPQAGDDTGGGGDALGSLAATVTGVDPAVGGESGTIAATVAGAGDSGSGTETGSIKIPGSDTGAGSSSLTSLNATVANSDSGVGSSGGFVDVLFGDLVVALFAVHPSTGALVPLPDFTKLTVAPTRNGPGSISLDYPSEGLNFSSLYGWTFGADRDLEVEIWLTGSATQALRGYLQEGSGDAVDEHPTWSFSGGFLELRLAEAEVFPQATGSANANAKRELVFSAVTPGAIVGTLLSQAQARGALTDLTKGFSNTRDSDDIPWPNVVTTKFSPGASYDQVLAKLVDLGLIEWAVTWTGTAKRLDLWIPGNRGVDRTTGGRPIILRAGRNLVDAPRKWSVRSSATAVLAAGSDGVYATASDANAQSRRGRRIETSASASNLSDLGAVQAYAGVQLAAVAPGILEVDHGLGFLPGEPRPVIAFNVGDWVYSQTATRAAPTLGLFPGSSVYPGTGTFPSPFVTGSPSMDRLRVVEWSLTADAGQNPSGTVTLNDSLSETLLKLRDRLNALSSGDTIIGTSSGGVDTGTPNPPTDVLASSTAYLVGGTVRSSVLVGWTAPTQNTDGSVITDLAGFSVQYGFGSLPTVWEDGAIVNSGSAVSGSFSTEPGKTIGIRVRAFDNSGNNSAWSATVVHTTAADAGAPATPSTPVVSNYLGVLKIAWDGLTSTGADMLNAAPDFDHVDVYVSTSSGFTPSSSTYFDRLFAAGTVVYTDGVYGTTYFAKLVAVDGSGNRSGPSAQGSDAPQQVVSLDIFDGAVGTAKLADAVITTAKINDLAVNNAKIGDLSVGKLTAGIMTASVTLSGIIRTATTGARSEMDAAGLRLYNSSNVNTVNLKTVDGSALVTGTFRSALSGERMEINPGAGQADTLAVYPSGGGSFATITARTAPSDGTAAILIDGGASTGTGRGRLGAYRSEGFISYVTSDSAGDTQSGFSRTAVTCSVNDVGMWAQGQIGFARYSGSSQLANSGGWIRWANGSISNCPVIGANAQDSGIKFDDGTTCATNAIGTLFGPMKATSFVVSSTAEVKTGIEDARTRIDARAVIRAARSKTWKYRQDVEQHGEAAAPVRFGPIAEELPDDLVQMTPTATGPDKEPSVDLMSQIGVLWAAINQLLDQEVRRTTATVTPPALTVANVDTDVTVAWDDGPVQTTPALVSIVPVGPGPLQQRVIKATVVSITTSGVTVRFRAKRALTGGSALDPDDRYVVNALYEWTPPPPS